MEKKTNKKKDMRIVTIKGYDVNTNEIVAFKLSVSTISQTLKKMRENKIDIVDFQIEENIVPIAFKNLKKIYLEAKKMFEKVVIPKHLKAYLKDLSEESFSNVSNNLIGRDEEIDRIFTCLQLKEKSNATIVGEHGVGKTTVVMEIVRMLKAKDCSDDLLFKQVLMLDTTNLTRLEAESRFRYHYIINSLFDFLKEYQNKIIIYVDKLVHMKFSIDIAKIMRYFYMNTSAKIISCVSSDDFKSYFSTDEELLKYLNIVLIREPEVDELYEILKYKIDHIKKIYDIDISEKMINFAILTSHHLSSSYSANPESLIDTINFALADAKRKSQSSVNKQNIISYYYMDFKLDKKISEQERRITAYHEVGHYIISKMSRHIKCFKNAFVSILPIDWALGLTASYNDLGKQLTKNKKYYIDIIAFDLGGRVGEELITNEYSSGAAQDLINANDTAEKVIMSWGLSERESEKNKNYFIGGYVKDYLLTDDIKNNINQEISDLISKAYDRAKEIINENRKIFDEIVNKLLEEGILTGDELDEICEKYSKNNS